MVNLRLKNYLKMQSNNCKVPAHVFFVANNQIKETNYDALMNMFEKAMQDNNLTLAKNISKKISVLYGMTGLSLYLPLQIAKIIEDKNQLEIIDQALIQLLALILYAESNGIKDNSLKKYKDECLELCDIESVDLLNSEAQILTKSYLSFNT